MSRRAPRERLTPVCSFINASVFLLYDLHYLSPEVSLTSKLLEYLLRLWGHIYVGLIKPDCLEKKVALENHFGFLEAGTCCKPDRRSPGVSGSWRCPAWSGTTLEELLQGNSSFTPVWSFVLSGSCCCQSFRLFTQLPWTSIFFSAEIEWWVW